MFVGRRVTLHMTSRNVFDDDLFRNSYKYRAVRTLSATSDDCDGPDIEYGKCTGMCCGTSGNVINECCSLH